MGELWRQLRPIAPAQVVPDPERSPSLPTPSSRDAGIEELPSASVIDASRLDRWERRTEWLLAGVTALFLAAYAWPILHPLSRPPVKGSV
jgi:hypothetical protein